MALCWISILSLGKYLNIFVSTRYGIYIARSDFGFGDLTTRNCLFAESYKIRARKKKIRRITYNMFIICYFSGHFELPI